MSLRVALVCPYSLDRPGGVATHVLGLARWLQDEGHRPVVVAPGVLDQDRGVPVTLLGRPTGVPVQRLGRAAGVRPRASPAGGGRRRWWTPTWSTSTSP